jgi:hypothetical protein
MTNFADVLTVLAAGGGLAVLLVMAAIPLLLDRDVRPERAAPVIMPGGTSAVGGRAYTPPRGGPDPGQ